MKEIVDNISLREFIDLVNLDDKLIVLDFFANWCGPCKRLTPFLEQCNITYKNVHFYKIDVDNTLLNNSYSSALVNIKLTSH